MQRGVALQCQGSVRAANPIYPRCATAKVSRRDVARRSYDIDVEAEPARAPNTGPTRGGPPPPPPPPPPPQQQRTALQPPSRRELLFGFLGLGLGVGGSTAFFNTQYELSEEGAFKGLDALLEDPDFLDAINEELMYTKVLSEVDESLEALEGLKTIEAELSNLNEQLAAAVAAEDAAAKP